MYEKVVKYGVIAVAIGAFWIIKILNNRIKDLPKPEARPEKIYIDFMPFAMVITIIYMVFQYELMDDPLIAWKRICFLPVLWMIAFTDYKMNLILNEYLILALIFRACLIIPEIILKRNSFWRCLMLEFIGSLIFFSFGILLRFLSRKGLGMGDIKLFFILPLLMGVMPAITGLIYSMIIMFILSCYFLITKKKGRKDTLPFGPSILAGMWLAMFVSYT